MVKLSYLQKFWILQSILVVLSIFAWVNGWIKLLLESDTSNISAFIYVVFLVSLFFVAKQNFSTARWVANRLVLMGLIGTLVGILFAMYSIMSNFSVGAESQSAENIAAMVYSMFTGLYIAIWTSLVGSLGYLWTLTCIRVLEPKET